MKVLELELKHFRSIGSLSLTPHEEVNIVCADNAQGKTNLLEAIWLFCGARSFRGAKDRDFIQIGKEYTDLKMTFFSEKREQSAFIRYGGPAKKQAWLNNVRQESVSKLTGKFHVVVFSPDHLWIVKHGPEKRRQLLDVALCQIYPRYQSVLDSYERILRQRGFLLKDARHAASLLEVLDAWDSHAAEYGGYITAMRARYVNRLSQKAASFYNGISSGKETLSVRYSPSFEMEHIEPADDRSRQKELLREALRACRQEDLRLGTTTVGPHRDDLILEIDGKNARAFASQGQQRSCVLALKLAECALLGAAAEEEPVILLDDVMSELDQSRRDYLLNHLKGRQVFITCCDTTAYQGLKEGAVFFFREGRLECAPH